MSHFGKSGPPDIKDTYSLLVLNIALRTTATTSFLSSIGTERSSTSSSLATEGLENRGGLLLYGISTKMKHRRRWTSLMGELWMEERLWFSLPSMGLMQNKFTGEDYPRQRYHDEYRDRENRRRSRSRRRDKYDCDSHRGRNDQRGQSNGRTCHGFENPDECNGNDDSPGPRSVSPCGWRADSQSMSPHRSYGGMMAKCHVLKAHPSELDLTGSAMQKKY
ncbi:hypothetical protein SLE2022_115860 [Rubroshorea leprosula]